MKFWNWSSMVAEWDYLLAAACRAVRSAVRFGAERELIDHWARLVFRLDSGAIDACGLTDLWALIRQEARRPAAVPILDTAQLLIAQRLRRDVYFKGWSNAI